MQHLLLAYQNDLFFPDHLFTVSFFDHDPTGRAFIKSGVEQFIAKLIAADGDSVKEAIEKAAYALYLSIRHLPITNQERKPSFDIKHVAIPGATFLFGLGLSTLYQRCTGRNRRARRNNRRHHQTRATHTQSRTAEQTVRVRSQRQRTDGRLTHRVRQMEQANNPNGYRQTRSVPALVEQDSLRTPQPLSPARVSISSEQGTHNDDDWSKHFSNDNCSIIQEPSQCDSTATLPPTAKSEMASRAVDDITREERLNALRARKMEIELSVLNRMKAKNSEV